MADPIPLQIAPRDPRAELRARLDEAPVEHAEALLSAYEILQGLHDKGMLDTVRAAIGSSDELIKMTVDAAKSPEAIRGMRNVIILSKLLAAFDTTVLTNAVQALPDALAESENSEPLTLLQLARKMGSKDCRRALTALTFTLESVGKALRPPDKSTGSD